MKYCMPFLLISFLFCSCKNLLGPESWSDVSNGIRFRIFTDKLNYLEGETILLYIEFENEGSEPKVILISPQQRQIPNEAPLYDIEKIKVQMNVQDSFFEITAVHSNMFITVPALLRLQPGERYKEKVKLFSGFWNYYHEEYIRDPFTFLKRGKYALQAIYTWDELPYSTPEREDQLEQMGAPLWTGYLESNKVTINILN